MYEKLQDAINQCTLIEGQIIVKSAFLVFRLYLVLHRC